jgi:8-oxo-dGTP pyrophosphatase MutT (NUDIX family)
LWKDIQPGKWDTSVGGHIAFGEKVESALRRETMEELGFENFTPLFLKRYVFESSREKELVHVYRTLYDGVIAPSAELNGGRFWKKEEISENLGKKVFTPNFESEYKLFFK